MFFKLASKETKRKDGFEVYEIIIFLVKLLNKINFTFFQRHYFDIRLVIDVSFYGRYKRATKYPSNLKTFGKKVK